MDRCGAALNSSPDSLIGPRNARGGSLAGRVRHCAVGVIAGHQRHPKKFSTPNVASAVSVGDTFLRAFARNQQRQPASFTPSRWCRAVGCRVVQFSNARAPRALDLAGALWIEFDVLVLRRLCPSRGRAYPSIWLEREVAAPTDGSRNHRSGSGRHSQCSGVDQQPCDRAGNVFVGGLGLFNPALLPARRRFHRYRPLLRSFGYRLLESVCRGGLGHRGESSQYLPIDLERLSDRSWAALFNPAGDVVRSFFCNDCRSLLATGDNVAQAISTAGAPALRHPPFRSRAACLLYFG